MSAGPVGDRRRSAHSPTGRRVSSRRLECRRRRIARRQVTGAMLDHVAPPNGSCSAAPNEEMEACETGHSRRFSVGVRARSELAASAFWTTTRESGSSIRLAREFRAQRFWLANDWPDAAAGRRGWRAKPAACTAMTRMNSPPRNIGHDPKWRFLNRPMVCALERAFIADAVVVSAVSAGIAEQLDRIYGLRRPAIVVRNTPISKLPASVRPVSDSVLYHGIIAPGRGLEAASTVLFTGGPIHLTLRGPGEAGFIASLQRRIDALGLTDRISVCRQCR